MWTAAGTEERAGAGWQGRGGSCLEAVSSGQDNAERGRRVLESAGGYCEGSVAKRERGQREDLDGVSGVGRARVMVMGISRGLKEARWKQGKEDGEAVVGLAVFCGQYSD